MPAAHRAWSLDVLLLLVVMTWGANYSVIKHAFDDIPPQPFNAVRISIAAVVYLAVIGVVRRRARSGAQSIPAAFYTAARLTSRDRWDLLWLGLIGHAVYQSCFVGGVNSTSVSNAALIIGSTPVVVAIASAALGRERIGARHWTGAAISAVGLYFLVGRGASLAGSTWRGDGLILVSVLCWSAYSIGSMRLLERHSPLFVTGMTMTIGAVPYTLAVLPQVIAVRWTALHPWTIGSLVLSALLALNVCYLIWYIGVQALGAARTSMFSNLVPITAMTVAALWLGEPVTGAKIACAAGILSGVVLTRLGGRGGAKKASGSFSPEFGNK